MRKIAKFLRRDHSVISREVSRNRTIHSGYLAEVAQRAAERRARKTNKRKLDKNETLLKHVVSQLKQGWSPDEIAGRLKKQPPLELKEQTISDETIYQYIYESPYGKYLYQYLRRKNAPRRQKMYSRKKIKLSIPMRVSIHSRPKVIALKGRYGDWESDTVVFSKQKTALSVQYERKSMLVRMHLIMNRSAEETREAIMRSVESLPVELWKSLTFDNGGEGVCHVNLRREFNLDTYFCDPFASWQKGGVENVNGLIRQYLPRTMDVSDLTDRDIHEVQERLNNRPRKSLDYLTPNEVIREQSGALNP